MKICPYCGSGITETDRFCSSCGAPIENAAEESSNNANSGTNYNSSYNENESNQAGAPPTGAAKTAAAVGGAMIGASLLNGLAMSLTHRRRPPYCPPPGMGFGGPMRRPGGGFGMGPGRGPGRR